MISADEMVHFFFLIIGLPCGLLNTREPFFVFGVHRKQEESVCICMKQGR